MTPFDEIFRSPSYGWNFARERLATETNPNHKELNPCGFFLRTHLSAQLAHSYPFLKFGRLLTWSYKLRRKCRLPMMRTHSVKLKRVFHFYMCLIRASSSSIHALFWPSFYLFPYIPFPLASIIMLSSEQRLILTFCLGNMPKSYYRWNYRNENTGKAIGQVVNFLQSESAEDATISPTRGTRFTYLAVLFLGVRCAFSTAVRPRLASDKESASGRSAKPRGREPEVPPPRWRMRKNIGVLSAADSHYQTGGIQAFSVICLDKSWKDPCSISIR